jgi:phosphatidylglycerophosphatase A
MALTPLPVEAKKDPVFWYATFFGSGLSPFMPGTAGTLASLLVWGPMVVFEVPWWARLALVAVFFVTGIPAATRSQKLLQKDDPGAVVIDEVAGQGLALALVGPSLLNVAVGFVLFRLFDIFKPWPVSWADRQHTGFGIMLDDILAGAYALGLLVLAEHYLWPALGLG